MATQLGTVSWQLLPPGHLQIQGWPHNRGMCPGNYYHQVICRYRTGHTTGDCVLATITTRPSADTGLATQLGHVSWQLLPPGHLQGQGWPHNWGMCPGNYYHQVICRYRAGHTTGACVLATITTRPSADTGLATQPGHVSWQLLPPGHLQIQDWPHNRGMCPGNYCHQVICRYRDGHTTGACVLATITTRPSADTGLATQPGHVSWQLLPPGHLQIQDWPHNRGMCPGNYCHQAICRYRAGHTTGACVLATIATRSSADTGLATQLGHVSWQLFLSYYPTCHVVKAERPI